MGKQISQLTEQKLLIDATKEIQSILAQPTEQMYSINKNQPFSSFSIARLNNTVISKRRGSKKLAAPKDIAISTSESDSPAGLQWDHSERAVLRSGRKWSSDRFPGVKITLLEIRASRAVVNVRSVFEGATLSLGSSHLRVAPIRQLRLCLSQFSRNTRLTWIRVWAVMKPAVMKRRTPRVRYHRIAGSAESQSLACRKKVTSNRAITTGGEKPQRMFPLRKWEKEGLVVFSTCNFVANSRDFDRTTVQRHGVPLLIIKVTANSKERILHFVERRATKFHSTPRSRTSQKHCFLFILAIKCQLHARLLIRLLYPEVIRDMWLCNREIVTKKQFITTVMAFVREKKSGCCSRFSAFGEFSYRAKFCIASRRGRVDPAGIRERIRSATRPMGMALGD